MARIPEYTTTRVLDELETAGFVERRSDPNNRRTFTIHLTAKGRRLRKTLVPLALSVNEQHLKSLKKGEAAELVRLLGKVATSVTPV